VGFGIDRRARSRKGRGLFRRAPDPREIGERFGRLVRRSLKDKVVRSGWKKERFIAELQLVPGTTAVASIGPDAELAIDGDAAVLGPGYIAEVVGCIAPILDELDYAWTEPFELAETQDAMCAWLAEQVRAAGQVQVGIPATRRFRIEAPVLTALGPRDAAWRDAVLADPRRAADAFAWWDVGPGRASRARALIAMWHEVPWREPLDKDERELMKQVDEDLRAARKADPAQDLPWAAWKELLAHLAIEDEDVDEHAGAAVSTIGYRRHDLLVELSGGWSVVLPAAMVTHWEDDGARFWATDGDRVVEFTSLTAEGEGDSDRLLAVAPEQHAVIERLSDGSRRGRAEAFDADDVHVVVGLMASAPHVGILTFKGGDQAWALATWRGLQLDA
jgi:hypothetical protein